MVFAFNEISNYGGKPAYLFEFSRGSTVWRYTGADRDVVFGGNTYAAKAVSCGAVRQTGDAQADEFTITAPASLDFVSKWQIVPPSERVRVTVRRYHRDDTDAAVRYVGFVDRVKRVGGSKTEIICKALTATFRRAGIRLPWQRQCPHSIFDSSCGLNKAAYANTAVVEALSGTTVQAAGLAAAGEGRLAAGFIEWTTAEGLSAWRAVTAHTTNLIDLLGGTYGLTVGDTIVAYPGCPRSAEACDGRYGNIANFGGFRHLPSRSPFDGNQVF